MNGGYGNAMAKGRKKSAPALYIEGLRTSVTSNASAYGFSIMITMSLAVASSQHGTPEVGEIFYFLLGAVAGFVSVEAVATRGFRSRDRGEPADVMVVGSAMAFVSVAGSVGVAALAGELLDGDLVWPVVAFAGTLAYTLMTGIEMALAARAEGQD